MEGNEYACTCKSDCPIHSIFSDFLESLCQLLYDTLRPLIIHIHHLETLSELTGILKSEMLGHHCATHPPQLRSFEKIISQLLQDVKERLVYRAYIYIRTDILGYTPAPGDLAYPEKLEMMESIAESLQQQPSLEGHQRQNSTSSLTSTTSLEVAQINGNRPMLGSSKFQTSPYTIVQLTSLSLAFFRLSCRFTWHVVSSSSKDFGLPLQDVPMSRERNLPRPVPRSFGCLHGVRATSC